MAFSKKIIDSYFTKGKDRYSKKTKLKVFFIFGSALGFLGVLMIIALLVDSKDEPTIARSEKRKERPQKISHGDLGENRARRANSLRQDNPQYINWGNKSGVRNRLAKGEGRTNVLNPSKRQYNAAQVIGQNAKGSGLPTGTVFPAKLLGKALSTQSEVPVQALVTEDVQFKGELAIPNGAKLIGAQKLNVDRRRLMLSFSKVIMPDGTERSISGLGLHLDGSTGIPGEFKSGELIRTTGNLLGRFTSGLARGLKDKIVGGNVLSIEEGSIKNGLLEGVADTSSEYARDQARKLQSENPSIEVEAGTEFQLFLLQRFK